MFKKMRRKEKQLTIEECHEVLTKAEYGTLATIGNDGYPYAVPLNYVFLSGNIYFHCAMVGHKLENIANSFKVSFNVTTDVKVVPLIPDTNQNISDAIFNGFDTNFNSVTIFGKAAEVFTEEKKEGLIALLDRFLNQEDEATYREAGIKYIEQSLKRTKCIRIEIEHITGKRGIRESRQILGKQH